MPALTFKLVFVPLILVVAVVTLIAVARRKVAPRPGMLWVILWLAAAFAIGYPSVVVQIARAVGIGRGADLVLYVFILFMMFALFVVYIRFRKLDEQITKIVRHLAITDARDGAVQPSEKRGVRDHREGAA